VADETKPPIRIYATFDSATYLKQISPYPNYIQRETRAAGPEAPKWLAWQLVHDGETGPWEVHRRPDPLSGAAIAVWTGDDITKLAMNGLSAGEMVV
jgi:hypothetical protein